MNEFFSVEPKLEGQGVYSGIHTFFALPYQQDLHEVDVAFFGMPFDIGVSNRPGCRFGPRAIRRYSSLNAYSDYFDFTITDYIKAVDYGDFTYTQAYIEKNMAETTEQLSEILAQDVIPIGIGGDHTLTFAELRAIAKKHGPVAFIHFDSHTDTWDSPDEYGNTLISHGTPFRLSLKHGDIDGAHGIQIGMRGGLGNETDHDFAFSHGMTIITGNELHQIGMEKAAEMIREKVADRPVFVTFDIDFLDPAYAPGTGTPVIGGFSTAEALKLLRLSLPGLNIVGMDLVEVAPEYDPSNATCLAAQSLLTEFLTILAYNKKQKQSH